MFSVPVTARYVRWVVSEWHGHMSMRAGILECSDGSCDDMKTEVPHYSRCKASSTYANDRMGYRHGMGHSGWSRDG